MSEPMPNPIPQALKEAACAEANKDRCVLPVKDFDEHSLLTTIARLLWENGWREPVDPDLIEVEELARFATILNGTDFRVFMLKALKRGRELERQGK